jgi:hypothetical protein
MTEFPRSKQLTDTIAGEITHGVTACVADQVGTQFVSEAGKALPSFFIVGPPRTGSSWLYEILSPHALLPSPLKETRFFDTHFDRGLSWYLAHYKISNGDRRIGEVAPTYFASAAARERMARTVPDAKIVCVFRDPVHRILSLYRLKRAYGMIPWSFEQALERDPELVESSRYASHLKLWQRSFGAANILACIYDDLRTSPQSFLDSLMDFVEAPRFIVDASRCGLVHDSEGMTHPRSYYGTRSATLLAEWFKSQRLDRVVVAFKNSRLRKLVLGGGQPFRQLSAELSKHLYERFRPEVEGLEVMLDRDLSSWKGQGSELR